MGNIIEEYKTFWKTLKPLMATQPIKGFSIEFSGSGDEGQIDDVYVITGGRRVKTAKTVKGEKDDYGHDEIPPHPWNHKGETILDEESTQKLVIGQQKTEKESFVEGKGWVKEEIITEIPLIELVREMAYKLLEVWCDEWEVNEGTRGTIYLYKKEAEYEFIKYFEDYDECQYGVRYYSKCFEVDDFDCIRYEDYDSRGIWVDGELDPIEEDED